MIKKNLRNIFITLLLATPLLSLADVLLTNPFTQVSNAKPTLPSILISQFYGFALMAAGGLAMGAIIYGAILYTLSSGNPGKQSDAKEWITQAIFGLALLLGAYLILNTINSEILINLNLGLKTGALNNLESIIEKTPAGRCLKDLRNNNAICAIYTKNNEKNGYANYDEAAIMREDSSLSGYNAASCPVGTPCAPCAATIATKCLNAANISGGVKK